MEELKESLCARCEHLGKTVFPSVEYFVDDGNGGYTARIKGYSDRPNGEPTDNPSRKCEHEKRQNVTVYEKLPVDSCCQYFKERAWERPRTCGECSLKTTRYEDGRFLCSGDLFWKLHTHEDTACPNGKAKLGAQLTMF